VNRALKKLHEDLQEGVQEGPLLARAT